MCLNDVKASEKGSANYHEAPLDVRPKVASQPLSTRNNKLNFSFAMLKGKQKLLKC